MLLSIIMPVYNEEKSLEDIILKVKKTPYEKEIIIIDDGSTDKSRTILEKYQHDKEIRLVFTERNMGKGAALRKGFAIAKGEIFIIQDADLEYDPIDYPRLINPILQNKADIVFGSRFFGESHRTLYFWHFLGNKFLTTFSNVLNNINLSDMETGYKAFRKEIIQSIKLRCNRFGFEPEFTAKISRKKYKIYETAIQYHGRTYEEGKKITWKDGVRSVIAIMWFRFFN